MDTTQILIGIVVIAIVLYFLSNLKSKKAQDNTQDKEVPESEQLPYNLKKTILTNKEYVFFKALKPISEKHNLIVTIKIRLADFIYCDKKTEKFQSWFNKISSKHVDFLICNEQLEPLLAIELDDSTHNKPDRISRDKFIDKVYENVNLNILHIKHYDPESLESQILNAINNKSDI